MTGICMFIAANMVTRFPRVPGYQPILMGSGAGKPPEGVLTDATGDSIAEKNPYYCELTGLYWIWKNLELPDIVGLCHYRRYFAIHPEKYLGSWDVLERVIRLDGVAETMADMDIVLPQPIWLGCVEKQYEVNNRVEDLDVVKDILRKDCPECVPAMEEVLGGHRLYTGNMMIMRRELFGEYMEWLFHILFEAEKLISVPEDDPYQRRVFGFLAERLLNIYVVHRKLRIGECPVVVLPPLNAVSGDFRRPEGNVPTVEI